MKLSNWICHWMKSFQNASLFSSPSFRCQLQTVRSDVVNTSGQQLPHLDLLLINYPVKKGSFKMKNVDQNSLLLVKSLVFFVDTSDVTIIIYFYDGLICDVTGISMSAFVRFFLEKPILQSSNAMSGSNRFAQNWGPSINDVIILSLINYQTFFGKSQLTLIMTISLC